MRDLTPYSVVPVRYCFIRQITAASCVLHAWPADLKAYSKVITEMDISKGRSTLYLDGPVFRHAVKFVQ